GGRIEKKDVEDARLLTASGSTAIDLAPIEAQPPAHAAAAVPAKAAGGDIGDVRLAFEVMRRKPTRTPLNGTMRRIIADNMRRSTWTAAHATMSLAADVSDLITLRKELNSNGNERRITFTDLVVKAAARVLVDNPVMRSVIDGDDFVTLNDIDISVA